ncbi:MAG TPA: hypothetical protein VHV82_12655 [Sporichthyaceae bacterium]|nr:hypothetical protein [Sporichthyaceae bacterium]
MAWTGRYVIVWGGEAAFQGALLGDGARYDTRTRKWQKLSASPLSARTDAASVWTGSRMIVWGGRDAQQPGRAHNAADGAAYDPATDTWTMLPSAPIAARQLARAVWTGTRMVLLGGYPAQPAATGVDNFTDGASYDPATGTWQAIGTPADPDGHALEWTTSVATDHDVVAWADWEVHTGNSMYGGDDLFRLNPRTGRWTYVQPAQGAIPDVQEALWDGTGLYVRGVPYNCGRCPGPGVPPVTSHYRPDSDTWTALPTDTLDTNGSMAAVVGSDLFLYEHGWAERSHRGSYPPRHNTSYYDPRTRKWHLLPTAPFGCNGRQDPAFLGNAIAYWCPAEPKGPAVGHDGLLFTVGR